MAQKPGWKTSEAWLTMATMLVGWLTANDVFATMPTAAKVAAFIAAALAAAGYTYGRSVLKAGDKPKDPQ